MSLAPARIVEVDLTHGTVRRRKIPAATYRLVPGGSALAAFLLLQEMPAGVDPLGPDNLLVLAVSPLASLPISGQSRITAAARSPLTGTIGDSQAGGFFPAHFAATGTDALVVRGRSPHPVYLLIDDDEVEIRPAEHLWGRVTAEAERLIREELGDQRLGVALIGPAGENLVRFAAIINHASRANGRTGMGAVMGSKRLKAVAAKGSRWRRPADPAGFRRLAAARERLAQNAAVEELGKYGTAGIVAAQQASGGLPTRNYRSGVFDGYRAISGETMYETILAGRDTCHSCAVRCKRVVEVPAGRDARFGGVDPCYGGPEYETVAAFGAYCGVADLAAVAKASELCNKHGMDTISCGATIAWAMECFERGILTPQATGGLELRFGNAEAMVRCVELIAGRQGIGELLAEGSRLAARRLGPAAEVLAMHVKGSELPAHMPQVKRSLGLIYAVNPFGADHQSSEHDPVMTLPDDHFMRRRMGQLGLGRAMEPETLDLEKVRFAYYTQCMYSALDALGLCQFVWGPAWQLYDASEVVELLRTGVGWDTSLWEVMKVGERRLNLLRAFNAREGFRRAEDRLPDRLFQPLPDGRSRGVAVDRAEFEAALEAYYRMAGWDPVTGNPTRGKLEELGLGWVADLLARSGALPGEPGGGWYSRGGADRDRA